MPENNEDKASFEDLYQELEESCRELFLAEKPYLERRTLLRNQCKEIGLSIPDNDLFRIEYKVRHELRGQSEGDLPDVEITIPEEKWLCDQLFADNTLTVLTALQKAGKSAFVSAFLGGLTYGSKDFLGQSINAEKRPIIIVGTDQPLCDWREILVPAGLMEKTGEDKYKIIDPVKKLWHLGDPVHLDDQGIEKIANEADKYKGENPLVFADAYGRLVSPLGLNEGLPEAAEPINSLCEALAESGATLVLLHHASKSRSHERASNASRGGNALSAAASQISDVDYASESADLTKYQIMQQAGVAALGQAKAIPQSILSLLG